MQQTKGLPGCYYQVHQYILLLLAIILAVLDSSELSGHRRLPIPDSNTSIRISIVKDFFSKRELEKQSTCSTYSISAGRGGMRGTSSPAGSRRYLDGNSIEAGKGVRICISPARSGQVSVSKPKSRHHLGVRDSIF